MLRKDPLNRIDLGQIFHLKWVKTFGDLSRERSLRLDDTLSTNEATKTLSLTKDFGKKSKREIIKTISDQKTMQNIIESTIVENNEKLTRNFIELKHQNNESYVILNSKQESSSFLESLGLSRSKQESSNFLENVMLSQSKQDSVLGSLNMPSFFENCNVIKEIKTSFLILVIVEFFHALFKTGYEKHWEHQKSN